MMAFTAAAFAGHEEFGNFQDAGAVAAGLGKYVGHLAGVFFAIALIDALPENRDQSSRRQTQRSHFLFNIQEELESRTKTYFKNPICSVPSLADIRT